MSKENLDEVPRRTVDDGLAATGSSVEGWVHFHAENSFLECMIAAESCFLQRTRIKTTAELAE